MCTFCLKNHETKTVNNLHISIIMTAEIELHITIAQKTIDISAQLRKIAQLLLLNIWLLETNYTTFRPAKLPAVFK